MKPDHVQVVVRKHPRGRTTNVECRLCGTVQPLVVPGRRVPSEVDINRTIHLFGALHDQTCRDRVEGLVAALKAEAAQVEVPAEAAKVETTFYRHVSDAAPTDPEVQP
jgi:hypothetical protein